jgi:predicted HTH domain antitoxin
MSSFSALDSLTSKFSVLFFADKLYHYLKYTLLAHCLRWGVSRYSEVMGTANIRLPEDLVRAAGINLADPSMEACRLLALELYREDRLSLGRAAELCETPVEQFLEFAGRHDVPLHYGLDQLQEDRRTLERPGL